MASLAKFSLLVLLLAAPASAGPNFGYMGYTCMGNSLIRAGTDRSIGYDNHEECLKAVKEARNGLTCMGSSLIRAATDSSVGYEDHEKCLEAVNASREGFTCMGNSLIRAGSATSVGYPSRAECLKALAATRNGGDSELQRCHEQLASVTAKFQELKQLPASEPRKLERFLKELEEKLEKGPATSAQ